jgi:hypothetical protein
VVKTAAERLADECSADAAVGYAAAEAAPGFALGDLFGHMASFQLSERMADRGKRQRSASPE